MIAFVIIAATVPLSLTDTSQAATYLMCDPIERLVEVQVCDYSNSSTGGICFYSLRQRPFRTNSTNLRSLSGVTATSLPRDKETELHTFLGNRITKVEHRPSFAYGMVSISQFVPPHQTFKAQQKMILCGPYAVPTPEVVPIFELPLSASTVGAVTLAVTNEPATDLTCDPVERLVEVQVCDYSKSPYGGICSYALRERPFRTDTTNLRALSDVTVTSLPRDKEREIRTFLGNRITSVVHHPAIEFGKERINQVVPPYQKFTVAQKMILCGQYAVPTPEIVPTFGVTVDRWMLHPPSRKQFYLSYEEVHHPVAERKCKEMRGRLALLHDAGQFNFVAAIAVLRDRYTTSGGWWTGAVNFEASGRAVLQWAEGHPQYAITTKPSIDELKWGCVATLFHIRTFASVTCGDLLYTSLPYVCEKDPDVA